MIVPANGSDGKCSRGGPVEVVLPGGAGLLGSGARGRRGTLKHHRVSSKCPRDSDERIYRGIGDVAGELRRQSYCSCPVGSGAGGGAHRLRRAQTRPSQHADSKLTVGPSRTSVYGTERREGCWVEQCSGSRCRR